MHGCLSLENHQFSNLNEQIHPAQTIISFDNEDWIGINIS